MNLTQAKFQRHFETFVHNGKLPPAQAIMITIGYDVPALEAGHVREQVWLGHKLQTQVRLAVQKEATQAEKRAYGVAQAEMSSLNQTIRILFKGDVGVLTTSGLVTHHYSSGGTEPTPGNDPTEPGNGPEIRHAHAAPGIADKIASWQLTLTNIHSLSEDKQARLARAGWPAERLAAAAGLVEACVSAHNSQKQSVRDYQAESIAARTAEKEVRQWYDEAVRLVRLAIKQADPDNKQQLYELLAIKE